MKLIVFSGGTDPNHPKYEDVYGLIKKEASKRNIDVLIPTYEGHDSHPIKGLLTLKGATKIVRNVLAESEANKEPYVVVCRSFGCFPFAEVNADKVFQAEFELRC